jgi:hypothetical protein
MYTAPFDVLPTVYAVIAVPDAVVIPAAQVAAARRGTTPSCRLKVPGPALATCPQSKK